jgi:hypothetical protein
MLKSSGVEFRRTALVSASPPTRNEVVNLIRTLNRTASNFVLLHFRRPRQLTIDDERLKEWLGR